MKSLVFNLPVLTLLFTSGHGAADVIYSGLQDISIPTTYGGTYIDVDGMTSQTSSFSGWDLNPYMGGVYLSNSADFQPARDGTGGMDTVLNIAAGSTINSGLNFATGSGGSIDHLGTEFTAGQEGYLGFKLNGTDYGSMRVVFTNNNAGAMIRDWAYDNTGAAIKTGWITTGIVSPTAHTVTLNPGTGDSFTLGSVLADASGSITNSLVKNGTGTTTLSAVNTYTGATNVNAGKLTISSTGTINTSSGVTVAAGAKFVHNSSTALTAAVTLNGNTTANRAVLGGTGTVGTSVTLDNLGDTLSPGNSPGIQNYTPAQTWASFSYDWEVNNFTGTTAGTDFDQLGLASTLNLTGGSGAYILNVLGLTAGNVAGLVPDFSEINRSWTILTSTGITGFNAANWTIDTAGFTDPDTGVWSISQSGNNLVLAYTIVPEPRAALLGGLGLLILLRRRR